MYIFNLACFGIPEVNQEFLAALLLNIPEEVSYYCFKTIFYNSTNVLTFNLFIFAISIFLFNKDRFSWKLASVM